MFAIVSLISLRFSGYRFTLIVTFYRILATLLYLYVAYIKPYRRQVISINLRQSFKGISLKKEQELIKRYYRHICDLLVEPFMASNLGYLSIGSIVQYTNLQLLNELFAKKKDVILMLAHYGNWEYINTLPAVCNYEIIAIYAPLKNKFLHDNMLRLRAKFGLKLVCKDEWHKVIREKREKPALFIIIGDQRPAQAKHSLEFLNQKTYIQIGGERIARMKACPVLFLDIKQTMRNHYVYNFQLITEDASKEEHLFISKKYFQELERVIKNRPELWLWSHRRWYNESYS
ncbi:MAG TPA: lysophospholipid acyltransferase family protein [Pseudosphingobacterium sp.]|nr:lysophospholipid acyltransferase family protein [Pseudosphingobacterium sp.]